MNNTEYLIVRLCMTLQIKNAEELIDDTRHDLSKASKSKVATAKTLASTNEELRAVARETEDAIKKVSNSIWTQCVQTSPVLDTYPPVRMYVLMGM